MLQSYDVPTYQRPEVQRILEDLSLMEDLLGGTRKMHAQSHKYIRKWTAEKDEVYEIRRKCETIYEGTARTLSASVGMLFAKEPQIDWDPAATEKAKTTKPAAEEEDDEAPSPPSDEPGEPDDEAALKIEEELAKLDPEARKKREQELREEAEAKKKDKAPPKEGEEEEEKPAGPKLYEEDEESGAADEPTQMEEHAENIDGAGTALTVFAKRFAQSAIRDGLACLLVDHAPPPTGVLITAANEKELGLRPTWAMYLRSQVWSWRTAVVNNKTTLTQVVLHEQVELPLGIFGVEQRQQFRVLTMVNGQATWRILRRRSDKIGAYTMGDFELIGSGYFRNRTGEVADHLPFYIAYTGDVTGVMQSTLPLLGVAWANLSHWQQSTDLRFYRMLAAFPQPVVTGVLAEETKADGTSMPGTLKVGPMVAVHLNEGGEFEWKELTGSSMEQLVQGIEDKERQMSQLGMSFLTKQTRAQETAEAKRLDSTAENATLATAAQGIEDALNSALECHAWYLGIEQENAPTISINRDFESTAMDPQTMSVYIQAISQAGLPVRVLLEAWKAGGRLPPDTDLDELEAEMMAAIAQKEEEERQRREEALRQAGVMPNGRQADPPDVEIEYDAGGKKPIGMKAKKKPVPPPKAKV